MPPRPLEAGVSGDHQVRTEREIKAKLRYLEKRKAANPNFWNILTLNAYQDLLHWLRGGKFKHLEVKSKRIRKRGEQE